MTNVISERIHSLDMKINCATSQLLSFEDYQTHLNNPYLMSC